MASNRDLRHYPGQPLYRSQGYDQDPMYRNPGHTLPFPEAEDIPIALWEGGMVNYPAANWVTDGNKKVIDWESPLFDFRPDLRSADGRVRGGTPIWNIEAKLYVWIRGFTSRTDVMQNLRITGREFGHIYDPGEVSNLIAPYDVTQAVQYGTNQPNQCIVVFEPHGAGEGSPIRYWKLKLRFKKPVAMTMPTMELTAAVY